MVAAFMQAMLLMDDTGSLLRFVQRPNSVDLAEGCHILRSAGRYSELVALLQQHAQYDQALDLLRNLSRDPSKLEVPPRGRFHKLCQNPSGQVILVKLMASCFVV